MKKNYTTREKDGGEFAARRLSQKAQDVYYGCGGDLGIFEVETDDGTRYDTSGIIDLHRVTFDELQRELEDYADQLAEY